MCTLKALLRRYADFRLSTSCHNLDFVQKCLASKWTPSGRWDNVDVDVFMEENLEEKINEGGTLQTDIHQKSRKRMSTKKELELQHRKFVKRKIIEKKMRKLHEEKQPSLLTWAAKLQIQHLNMIDPIYWTPEMLADSFPVSPDVIKKILRNRHHLPDEEYILKHDRNVYMNWLKLKEAKEDLIEDRPVDPQLRSIIESEKLNKIINASGSRALPVPDAGYPTQKAKLEKLRPKTKGEFSAILDGFYEKKDRVKQEEEIKLSELEDPNYVALLTDISEVNKQGDKYNTRNLSFNVGKTKYDFMENSLKSDKTQRGLHQGTGIIGVKRNNKTEFQNRIKWLKIKSEEIKHVKHWGKISLDRPESLDKDINEECDSRNVAYKGKNEYKFNETYLKSNNKRKVSGIGMGINGVKAKPVTENQRKKKYPVRHLHTQVQKPQEKNMNGEKSSQGQKLYDIYKEQDEFDDMIDTADMYKSLNSPDENFTEEKSDQGQVILEKDKKKRISLQGHTSFDKEVNQEKTYQWQTPLDKDVNEEKSSRGQTPLDKDVNEEKSSQGQTPLKKDVNEEKSSRGRTPLDRFLDERKLFQGQTPLDTFLNDRKSCQEQTPLDKSMCEGESSQVHTTLDKFLSDRISFHGQTSWDKAMNERKTNKGKTSLDKSFNERKSYQRQTSLDKVKNEEKFNQRQTVEYIDKRNLYQQQKSWDKNINEKRSNQGQTPWDENIDEIKSKQRHSLDRDLGEGKSSQMQTLYGALLEEGRNREESDLGQTPLDRNRYRDERESYQWRRPLDDYRDERESYQWKRPLDNNKDERESYRKGPLDDYRDGRESYRRRPLDKYRDERESYQWRRPLDKYRDERESYQWSRPLEDYRDERESYQWKRPLDDNTDERESYQWRRPLDKYKDEREFYQWRRPLDDYWDEKESYRRKPLDKYRDESESYQQLRPLEKYRDESESNQGHRLLDKFRDVIQFFQGKKPLDKHRNKRKSKYSERKEFFKGKSPLDKYMNQRKSDKRQTPLNNCKEVEDFDDMILGADRYKPFQIQKDDVGKSSVNRWINKHIFNENSFESDYIQSDFNNDSGISDVEGGQETNFQKKMTRLKFLSIDKRQEK